MPFALEQTTELETSIAPSDQEIRRLCRNLEDRKRSPGRRHLIPRFFVDPGQWDCNTDGGNFGEGHVDNLCSTWQRWSCLHYFFFPVRMTQQQKNIMLGYNFFTVLVAWTNSPSTMRSIPASQMVVALFSKNHWRWRSCPQASSFKGSLLRILGQCFRLFPWLWDTKGQEEDRVFEHTSPWVVCWHFVGNQLTPLIPHRKHT